MDFVDQHQRAVLVGTEFVFGIDQDEAVARRKLPATREQGERCLPDALEHLFADKTLGDHLLWC